MTNLPNISNSAVELTTYKTPSKDEFVISSRNEKYLGIDLFRPKRSKIFHSKKELERSSNYRPATWDEIRTVFFQTVYKDEPSRNLKGIVRQYAKEHDDKEALDLVQIDEINPENGHTKLTEAVSKKDKHAIATVISVGACPNASSAEGLTPLTLAAKSGQKDIVDLLLHLNANPNTQDVHGRTAIHYAARRGSKAQIELLIKYGAIINIADESGYTPLHFAALYGKLRSVKLLLATEGNRIVIEDLSDKFPIIMIDKNGKTPLHIAVGGIKQEKRIKIVKELLIEIKNHTDFGALHSKAHVLVIDLQDKYDLQTPLHLAAILGETEVAEALLQAGAKPNIKDAMGNTPLHLACENGHQATIQMLMRYSANPSIRNQAGEVPKLLRSLQHNSKHKETEQQRRIDNEEECKESRHVAKVEEPYMDSAENETLDNEALDRFIATITKQDIEEFRKLLGDDRHLAQINKKNGSGNLPLNLAVEKRSRDMIRELLAAKADPNLVDDDGNTALHLAARCCDFDIVKMLLPSGSPSVRKDNKKGMVPVEEAVMSKGGKKRASVIRKISDASFRL